ncbi:unnamed protein product, partial [Adineta steineri]
MQTDKASGEADDSSKSVLSKQAGYTTYKLSTNDEIKSVGFVFTMLRKSFGDDFDAKGNVPQIAFTKDFRSAIFDLPSSKCPISCFILLSKAKPRFRKEKELILL